MTPEDVAAHFTRADGSYLFARWNRALAPVVFGVEDATLAVVRGAAEAVAELSGIGLGGVDAELGANLMVFFFRDWAELPQVPDLDRIVPDIKPLVARLEAAGANQYRIFRFDPAGGIRACFVFVRMDDQLAAVPAEVLALNQMAQAILLWSDTAFTKVSPLARAGGTTLLRPEIGALIRAAYDPVLPCAATDPAHALRLHARLSREVAS